MDLNVTAYRIVKSLTDGKHDDKRVVAARTAGKIGGPARARKLTTQERREIAVKANRARWRKARNH